MNSMDAVHGLTSENLLRSFPAALAKDPSAVALAEVTARILSSRLEEIDLLRIFPDIDRLDEAMLDMLAYDFKVDWWDPNYSLEEKRRTLRDSWNVHRRLGTRWAVTTALGNVIPGADVEEWFQYGGTPYCFRISCPLPEEGLSIEQQRRALQRVWYYKNLRSHLESLDIQTESTGLLQVGACSTASTVLEIWPELVSGMEITGQAGIAAKSTMRQSVEIYPELVSAMEVTGGPDMVAAAASHQTVEVFPEPTEQISVESKSEVSGIAAAHQTMEIYPE